MIKRRGFIAAAVASAFPAVTLPITPVQSVQAAAGFASPESWKKCLEMSMAEFERPARRMNTNVVYGAHPKKLRQSGFSGHHCSGLGYAGSPGVIIKR